MGNDWAVGKLGWEKWKFPIYFFNIYIYVFMFEQFTCIATQIAKSKLKNKNKKAKPPA